MSSIRLHGRIARISINYPALMAHAGSECERLTSDMCRTVVTNAMWLAPVKTGRLRRSHRITIRRESGMVRGEVLNEAEYSGIVHQGGGRRRANPWLRNAAERAARSNGWRFQR